VPHTLVLRRRVQFYETDAAGIVHFSNFFRYMEEAEHALWRANGLSVFPAAPTHGWPRVAASFDFRRPLRFEDEFEVRIEVTHVSGRSLTYACRILCRDELVADGRMTVACVDKQPDGTLKAATIPDDIAARLRPPASAAGSGAAGPAS
jgi:YbgC/YbaW family acyl-CoA thioester hydrolase